MNIWAKIMSGFFCKIESDIRAIHVKERWQWHLQFSRPAPVIVTCPVLLLSKLNVLSVQCKLVSLPLTVWLTKLGKKCGGKLTTNNKDSNTWFKTLVFVPLEEVLCWIS